MKTATIRELRTEFPKLEALLFEGEEIVITRRNRAVARLVPERKGKPNFKARFGGPVPKPGPYEKSLVHLLSEDRGE